jgi:hypothetical protein
MNNVPDPLELELSSLRPREVSPRLRRLVAARLASPAPARPEHRWLRRCALAAGLAAVCLAAVFTRWGDGLHVEWQPLVVRPQPAPPVEVEDVDVQDAGPTLLAYQRALARSPEELDALLERHARGAPEGNPALARIRAFTRSDAEIHALLGDD